MSFIVYEFRAADGEVLYVGATQQQIEQRIAQHARKPWWSDVVHVSTSFHESRAEMLEVEAERIRELNPRHNINGGGRGIRADRQRHEDTATFEELWADYARKARIVEEMFR